MKITNKILIALSSFLLSTQHSTALDGSVLRKHDHDSHTHGHQQQLMTPPGIVAAKSDQVQEAITNKDDSHTQDDIHTPGYQQQLMTPTGIVAAKSDQVQEAITNKDDVITDGEEFEFPGDVVSPDVVLEEVPILYEDIDETFETTRRATLNDAESSNLILPIDIRDFDEDLRSETTTFAEPSTKDQEILAKEYYHFGQKSMVNKACVLGLINQGMCGSCWAWATARAVAERTCIQTNAVVRAWPSPSAILQCTDDCGRKTQGTTNMCDGGWIDNGLGHMYGNAIPSRVSQPIGFRNFYRQNKCQDSSILKECNSLPGIFKTSGSANMKADFDSYCGMKYHGDETKANNCKAYQTTQDIEDFTKLRLYNGGPLAIAIKGHALVAEGWKGTGSTFKLLGANSWGKLGTLGTLVHGGGTKNIVSASSSLAGTKNYGLGYVLITMDFTKAKDQVPFNVESFASMWDPQLDTSVLDQFTVTLSSTPITAGVAVTDPYTVTVDWERPTGISEKQVWLGVYPEDDTTIRKNWIKCIQLSADDGQGTTKVTFVKKSQFETYRIRMGLGKCKRGRLSSGDTDRVATTDTFTLDP